MSGTARGELAERICLGLPHLGEREIDSLAEIVGRLIEAYEPERIYLFGSMARGDQGPDSDFDLLVVVPDEAPQERRRSRLAYEVLRGTGTAADALVWTQGRFESRIRLAASLPATVVREGRVVHDPVQVAETRAWFHKAAEDLRAAEHEFGAVPPLLAGILFHCQQAV